MAEWDKRGGSPPRLVRNWTVTKQSEQQVGFRETPGQHQGPKRAGGARRRSSLSQCMRCDPLKVTGGGAALLHDLVPSSVRSTEIVAEPDEWRLPAA